MSHPHIDVRRIATLARLELSEDEVASFSAPLDGVLTLMEKLSQVDTEGVEPTSYPMPIAAPMREDVAWQSMPTELFLRNAPEQAQQQIRVPKVVADA